MAPPARAGRARATLETPLKVTVDNAAAVVSKQRISVRDGNLVLAVAALNRNRA